jgi:TrmH family RNA methyltransferase
MISNNQLRHFSSLLTKKFRLKENKFIVEGERSVIEGLNGNLNCEAVLFSREYFDQNKEKIELIKNKNLTTFILDSNEFKKISDTKSPQGIAGVFIKKNIKITDLLPATDNLIVLIDNISDPGNLGTIIRNCDWFGIKTIILSKNTVEYTNPKVLRSTMGSIFHIDIIEITDFFEVEKLKASGYDILCADTKGDIIFNYENKKKKIIVFSNEAHGPSEEILKYINNKITIPKIGNAESLNVASASAVILAELTKQRFTG